MGTALSKEQIEQTYDKINRMNTLLKDRGADYVIQVYKQARPEKSLTVDEVLGRSDPDYVAKVIIDSYRPKNIPAPQKVTQQVKPTQQAIPTQPEEQKQGLGAKILGIGRAIDRPGIEASQKIRSEYLKITGVIPSVTKLENKVFVEKDRDWLSEMASKGKMPPESDIISKLGEDRGRKLVTEINRLSPKLFSAQATRRARGEMGTQYATSILGVIGEEVMNAIEQLTGAEQVLQPSQLALNLAGIGIGSKVATVAVDNVIKKGLSEAVKAKTMTPEMAKTTFKAYKYYYQNTPAETIQAILRGDIPVPKVPEGGIIYEAPKPKVSTAQRVGFEYAPTGEEIRAGKKPTVTPVRGAMPSGITEPITQVRGVEQVQALVEPSTQKPTFAPKTQAEKDAEFDRLFPDITEKPIETPPEVKAEIPTKTSKSELDTIKKNLLKNGAAFEKDFTRNMILPDGTHVSIPDKAGEHWKYAQYAGYLSKDEMPQNTQQIVSGLVKKGWIRHVQITSYEAYKLDGNTVKLLDKELSGWKHGNETFKIDIMESGDSYSFKYQDYIDNDFSLKKTLSSITPNKYNPGLISDLTLEKHIQPPPEVKATEIPQEKAKPIEQKLITEPDLTAEETYQTILKNEGPEALKLVRGVNEQGIYTIDTHIKDNGNTIRLQIYPENDGQLMQIHNTGVKMEEFSPDGGIESAYYIEIPKDKVDTFLEYLKSDRSEFATEQMRKELSTAKPTLQGEVPKEPTKPADMTDAELQAIVNQSKDDYVRRNFPSDIKKVYDNPISKGTMNISSYSKDDIFNYLMDVRDMVKRHVPEDTPNNNLANEMIDVDFKGGNFVKASNKAEILKGVVHNKIGRLNPTLEEANHRYVRMEAEKRGIPVPPGRYTEIGMKVPEKVATPEPKAETPTPEAPDSEIRQRIDQELRDKNLADTAQFNMDLGAKVEIPETPEGLTIAKPDEIVPPEDLIQKWMERKGYSREEAIADIKKQGGFVSFGKDIKPPLVENVDPVNDATMERFRNAQKIMRNIPDETKPFAQIMSELYSEVVDSRWALKLYRKYAEKTSPIGVKVLAGKDPFLLASRYHGIGGIIRSKLEWKTTRLNDTGNLEKTGAGLEQALSPISRSAKQLEDFEDFLTAQTIIEDSMYGYSNQKATIEASEYVNAMINKYGKNYDTFFKAAEDVRDWYVRAAIDPLHEAGIMSDETYKTLLDKREFWSPMKRYIEGEYDQNGKQIKSGLMDTVAMPARGDIFQPKGKLIHERKGSEKSQIPALEGILTNVYRINNFVERHRVARAVVELRNMSPEMRDLIVPVMDPKFDTNFAGRNIISVFEKGVGKYYQVPDDLYKALTHLDLISINLAEHIMSMPARILRTGAIDTPDFFLRNIFFRDPISAFILAKHSLSLPNFARGFADVIGKSETYWEMMASGGDSAMLVSLDRMSSRARLKELSSSKTLWEKTHKMLAEHEMSKPKQLAIGTKNVVKHPLDALQMLAETSEKPTRMGVFRGAKQAGETDIVAMYEYRDVPDFAIKGQAGFVNFLNEMVPFWRAGIRGFDKMGRSLIERPKKTFLRGLLAITVPTIGFFVLNKVFNREKFDQYTQDDKDKYWFIPTGEGNEDIRLQKPFDVGAVFSVPLEHYLEYLDKKDTHAMEALYETMFSMGKQLNPGMIIPQIIKPGVEIGFNKNLYTGKPIIPGPLEDELAQDQFQPYSSETAKQIGNFIKVSPLQIDHAINGYFASLGRYFVKGVDEIIKGGQKSAGTYIPRPKGTLATAPVARAYFAMKPEGTLSNSVTELYRLLGKTTKERNHLEKMTKQYGGNSKEVVEFIKKNPEMAYYKQLSFTSKLISNARKQKMVIYNDPKMNPKEKRQKIDALDGMMTNLADITTIIVNTATKHQGKAPLIPSFNMEQTKEPAKPERRKSIGHPLGLEYLNE